MKKMLLLACVSLALGACTGMPFLTIEFGIPPGSPALGERVIVPRSDHDVIELGPNDGSFSSLVFVVQDSDVAISDVVVSWDNGDRERIPGRLVFNHGARSHPLKIHGKGKHRIVS